MSISTDIKTEEEMKNDAAWKRVFLDGDPELMGIQVKMMSLSGTKRCRLCKAPFDGDGLPLNIKPSDRNPNFCNQCDVWIAAHHPGGVESNFPVIAVDIRGSTALSEDEGSGPFYHHYLRPFAKAMAQALFDTDGFVAERRGDELRGVYPPGFSGANYVRKMIEAARRLLQELAPKTQDGILIPIGIGVHIGDIRIGTSPEMAEVAITGPGVNICSLMASAAGKDADGKASFCEAFISEVAYEQMGLPADSLEKRPVPLKGKKEPVLVYVMTAESAIEPFPIVH